MYNKADFFSIQEIDLTVENVDNFLWTSGKKRKKWGKKRKLWIVDRITEVMHKEKMQDFP